MNWGWDYDPSLLYTVQICGADVAGLCSARVGFQEAVLCNSESQLKPVIIEMSLNNHTISTYLLFAILRIQEGLGTSLHSQRYPRASNFRNPTELLALRVKVRPPTQGWTAKPPRLRRGPEVPAADDDGFLK